MRYTKKKIERHWERSSVSWLTGLLLPLSGLFRLVVAVRYFFYRIGFLKKIRVRFPVIVVGNLTLGGTGKTPFVIWLAEILQKQGYRPGIVSRGVGGKQMKQPYWVDAYANPCDVGDEALLLVKRTQCPMVVCVDRVLAAKELLSKTNCNIVISDDGLQHYRLARDIEIVIVDGLRQWGNGQLLPAGPLREPLSRLCSVDVVVVNGHDPVNSVLKKEKWETMELRGDILFSLLSPHQTVTLKTMHNKTVHAVAGIGCPERFFQSLRNQHIHVIKHVFPDHYLYKREDIYFSDALPVIMTEKDAVKCMGFADQRHWYLPVQAEVSAGLEQKIFSFLDKRK